MGDSGTKSKLPAGYKQGVSRPFYSTFVDLHMLKNGKVSRKDKLFMLILVAVGIIVRAYKLPTPPRAVFDEVHYLGYALDYLHGDFFVDVHPPLAKLIFYWITLFLSPGAKADTMKVGDKFDPSLPYVALRLFPVVCGILTIVLSYRLLRVSGCRSWISFTGAFLIAIENSLVTQSRLILIDAPLIFAISLTVFAIQKADLVTPFTRKWYQFIIVAGFGLGAAMSIKWVGFFTAAWVACISVLQLWNLLGDLDVSDRKWFAHLGVRLGAFVALPLAIYCSLFAVHFHLLPYGGLASGMLSPSFQATFKDATQAMPVQVLYGSTVTIKHNSLDFYLHSHNYTYKGGSGEQQVTLYGQSFDGNNEWIVETQNKTPEGALQKDYKEVKDGDVIRLYHKFTGKYLHVNDVRPPISEHDYSNEVSCAGDRDLLGDSNYEFTVRILLKKSHSENDLPMIKLRATETIFQLIHRGTLCVVMSHKDKLPEWGYFQNEVLCVDEPTIPNTMWYVASNSHPVTDNDDKYERVHYKNLTFFDKLWEYHIVMWRVNAGLSGKKHPYASTPESWPFLTRGINYFSQRLAPGGKSSDEPGLHIYLIGNPAIYIAALITIIIVVTSKGLYLIIALNPFKIPDQKTTQEIYHRSSFRFLMGWVVHYFPFFWMTRELYLHHYLVPLYFSVLLFAQFAEYQVSQRRWVGYASLASIVVGSIYYFIKLSPVIYGTPWTREGCLGAKGIWDIDCSTYVE